MQPDLKALALEITIFRQSLITARANLPHPGYHFELDSNQVATVSNFLEQIPQKAGHLCRQIEKCQKQSGHKVFGLSLLILQQIRRKPRMVFQIRSIDLETQLNAREDQITTFLDASRQVFRQVTGGGV